MGHIDDLKSSTEGGDPLDGSRDVRTFARMLSHHDLVDALEFADLANRTCTRAAFSELVTRMFSLLPIHGIDVRVASLGQDNQIVGTTALVAIDYPDAWIEQYRDKSLRSVDPVAPCLYRDSTPLIWSKLRKRHQSVEHQAFYRSAEDYGLLDGFAYGQRFFGRKAGSFVSCISEDLARHTRHEAMLALISPHLHTALARCSLIWDRRGAELTPRETEVLALVKSGKTNPEIGAELAISARAVKFHLENAIRKLGARGRTDAVVVALAQGLIEW